MLLTPLLSASPLAVPPSAQQQQHQHHIKLLTHNGHHHQLLAHLDHASSSFYSESSTSFPQQQPPPSSSSSTTSIPFLSQSSPTSLKLRRLLKRQPPSSVSTKNHNARSSTLVATIARQDVAHSWRHKVKPKQRELRAKRDTVSHIGQNWGVDESRRIENTVTPEKWRKLEKFKNVSIARDSNTILSSTRGDDGGVIEIDQSSVIAGGDESVQPHVPTHHHSASTRRVLMQVATSQSSLQSSSATTTYHSSLDETVAESEQLSSWQRQLPIRNYRQQRKFYPVRNLINSSLVSSLSSSSTMRQQQDNASALYHPAAALTSADHHDDGGSASFSSSSDQVSSFYSAKASSISSLSSLTHVISSNTTLLNNSYNKTNYTLNSKPRLITAANSSLYVNNSAVENNNRGRTDGSLHVDRYSLNNVVNSNSASVNRVVTTSTSSAASTTSNLPASSSSSTISSSSFNNTTSTTTTSSSSSSFLWNYGYIIAVFVLSLVGVLIIALFGVIRCLRATTQGRPPRALAIALLPEDRTPLNAEPDNPVPMLSVQSPSCAGMERLCAPTRTSLNTSADHHPMGRRILHQAGLQVRSSNASTGGNGGSGGHLYTAGGGVGANSHHGGSINVPSYQHQINRHSDILEYPHHVPLPDSEWGQDRHIQIRPHYQQTELTRTYIKPPPNKTVLDVPSNNIFLSSTSSSLSLSSSTSASCNYNNYNSDNNNFHHNHHQQQHHNHHHHQHHHPVHSQRTVTSSSLSGNNLSGANPAISSSKSKPNPIAKFFYRISNPKQSDHNTAASNGPSAAVGAASSSPSCGGGLVASRCSAPVTAGCYTATNNVMVYPSTPSLSYSFGGGGGSSVGGNSLSTTSSLGGASCPTATAATINLMPNQSPSLLLNSSSTNTSLASLQPKSSCSDNEYSGDTTTSMPANSNNLVADRGSGDSGTENINADTAAARNNCNNGRQSPPEGVHQV